MLHPVSIDPGVAFLLIIYILLLGKVVGLRQTVQRWCRGMPKSLERHSRYSRHAEAWHGHGGNWHHSPGATAAEQAAIEDAKARLPVDALALTLGRALACGDPAFEMELLRKLRTLPSGARDGESLAAVMCTALAWKRVHAKPAAAGGGKAHRPPSEGLAAADLVHGEWACRFLVMGMRCGRSLGGHPVKIERIGANDMQGIASEPGGEDKLRAFYHDLLGELCASLNAESATTGVLLRSYEVFDMKGLSLRNALSPVVFRFTAEQLSVVGRVYSGQAQRVAVINVSAFTLTAIQPLLLMLPSHVRERVHILGADWEQFLAADLDEEALSFLKNGDRHTLARHRGRYLREAPDGRVTAVG